MPHHALEFVDPDADLTGALVGNYDLPLVALSVLIACVAGYAALLLAERVSRSPRPYRWLAAGAFAMGSGIWTMHFLGMLAFALPVPVTYDLEITLLSLLPALAGSGVALLCMSRARVSLQRLNGAGLLMGVAIGAMHYTGMAAMVMPARMAYDRGFFLLSLVVAYALATLALFVALGARRASSRRVPRQIAGGAIMGCAISGMHYTAMSAAGYLPSGEPVAVEGLLTFAAGMAIGPPPVPLSMIMVPFMPASGAVIAGASPPSSPQAMLNTHSKGNTDNHENRLVLLLVRCSARSAFGVGKSKGAQAAWPRIMPPR